jgi:hypothetical protein
MFRVLPPFGGEPRAVAEILNGVMNGKTNNTGTISFVTDDLPLTVEDARCGFGTVVLLSPTNSRACQLINHVFISSTTSGSFVIDLRSGSSGSGTANFSYALIG